LRADMPTASPMPVVRDAVEIIDAPRWVELTAGLLDLVGDPRLAAVERARSYPLPHAGAIIRHQGEVVACGLVKLEGAHAGLFALNTAPAHRRRGLGLAIVGTMMNRKIDDPLSALAARLGGAALARGAMVATAESCTGGLVAGAITAIAGSSAWFERGFVTYSNLAKEQQLGVAPSTIERFGAVSEETVREMAQGALRGAPAQWAVAVTGIAGPDGGSPDKPVGTVWFAWAGPDHLQTLKRQFEGDRAAVREASVRVALEGLVDRLA